MTLRPHKHRTNITTRSKLKESIWIPKIIIHCPKGGINMEQKRMKEQLKLESIPVITSSE